MRPHRFQRHKSAVSLIRESLSRQAEEQDIAIQQVVIAGHPGSEHPEIPRTYDSMLKSVRKSGMWAYVDVPEDESLDCTIHFWYKKNTPLGRVALMLGHECGHISCGGPFADIPPAAEEHRADSYGQVASEVVVILQAMGVFHHVSKRKKQGSQ